MVGVTRFGLQTRIWSVDRRLQMRSFCVAGLAERSALGA